MDAAASFWPLSIPKIPALTFSAINVDVYSDNAKAKAINSGMIDTPQCNLLFPFEYLILDKKIQVQHQKY